MRYQNTQQGVLIYITLLCSLIVVLSLLVIVGIKHYMWSLPAIGILLLCLPFSILTVEVDGEELRHYFGFGFWKKSYQLEDIQSIKAVRNSWLYGWGIRLTPHGWLYNVSGLDAVEIELHSGRKFRIGTNQPAELSTTLQSAIKTP